MPRRVETYLSPNRRTGQPQARCSQCHKVAFFSKKAANQGARGALARGVKMRVYLGTCGHWHVTTSAR